ncbi:hypothetical protein ACFXAZ_27420 [Streptomyces sp. NPDC059477]|uniref:hypothetical protein n=1 Tax=Streptomyces sp. NPDC059477 TaxID=3346847 RepID=UPI0036B0E81A
MSDPAHLKADVEHVPDTFLAREAGSTTADGRLPNPAAPVEEFPGAEGKGIRPVLTPVGRHAAGATVRRAGAALGTHLSPATHATR